MTKSTSLKVALTEKRMVNRRFKRTEEIILSAYREENYNSVNKIIKRAGITRSSFYHHHKTATMILSDYREYILRKYTSFLNKLFKKEKVNLKNAYFKMLLFIVMHKKIFLMFLRLNDKIILDKMLEKLWRKKMSWDKMSKEKRRKFEIYKATMIVLIKEWGKEHFREENIEKVVNEMVKVTEKIGQRWG